LLDNDRFRRDWLAAAGSGRPGFQVAPDISVPAQRDAQLDLRADLLAANLDLSAMLALLEGPPPTPPVITSGLVRLP
jgi:adenosylcobyric acid synthase